MSSGFKAAARRGRDPVEAHNGANEIATTLSAAQPPPKPPPGPPPPGASSPDAGEEVATLWVGSLLTSVTDDDLFDAFMAFGFVSDVNLSPQPLAGQLQAFVKFAFREEAEAALNEALNRKLLVKGKAVTCRWAKQDIGLRVPLPNTAISQSTVDAALGAAAEAVPKLWIGNLPLGITEADLRMLCSSLGLELAEVFVHQKPSLYGQLSAFLRFKSHLETKVMLQPSWLQPCWLTLVRVLREAPGGKSAAAQGLPLRRGGSVGRMAPPCCCPEGAEPLRVMKDYKPRGEMVEMEASWTTALSCYVATPQEVQGKGVVMFTDMFGVDTGRHRMICDTLADAGYLVVCPDLISRKPYLKHRPQFGATCCCTLEFMCKLLTGAFDRRTKDFAWDKEMGRLITEVVLPWMTAKGVAAFGAVGFCWGAYGAMKCAAIEGFKCSASYHPSVEGFCKGAGEDDLKICKEVRCPVLVVATSMESARWKPDGEAQKACEEAVPGKVKWLLEAKEKHGYMTRGLTTDSNTFEAVKRGMDELSRFFETNLA